MDSLMKGHKMRVGTSGSSSVCYQGLFEFLLDLQFKMLEFDTMNHAPGEMPRALTGRTGKAPSEIGWVHRVPPSQSHWDLPGIDRALTGF